MSLPIITPAEDQPIWALKQELEALGGVRHQDFKVVPGNPRWGYQVTPELYQKWLESGGIDTSGGDADTPPSTEDSGGDENSEPATGTPEAAAEDANADDNAREDAAPKASAKASAKATTTKPTRR